MARIDIISTSTINATADHLWRILGDGFLDVAEWVAAIDHATANPLATTGPSDAPVNGRSCTIAGFGQTDERLVEFDRARRTFAYTVTAKKLPSFVRGMRNDWAIEPTGNQRATVTSRITADATGPLGSLMAPMMRLKLRSTQRAILDDLRVYAETGRPSPAKQKARSRGRAGIPARSATPTG